MSSTSSFSVPRGVFQHLAPRPYGRFPPPADSGEIDEEMEFCIHAVERPAARSISFTNCLYRAGTPGEQGEHMQPLQVLPRFADDCPTDNPLFEPELDRDQVAKALVYEAECAAEDIVEAFRARRERQQQASVLRIWLQWCA